MEGASLSAGGVIPLDQREHVHVDMLRDCLDDTRRVDDADGGSGVNERIHA